MTEPVADRRPHRRGVSAPPGTSRMRNSSSSWRPGAGRRRVRPLDDPPVDHETERQVLAGLDVRRRAVGSDPEPGDRRRRGHRAPTTTALSATGASGERPGRGPAGPKRRERPPERRVDGHCQAAGSNSPTTARAASGSRYQAASIQAKSTHSAGQLVGAEDRRVRAGGLARAAVDAGVRVDVELAVDRQVGADAVDRTDRRRTTGPLWSMQGCAMT